MAISLADALERLQRNQQSLNALGVRHAAVFGSVARGQADGSSDIDIAVTVERPMPASRFIPLCEAIENALGCRADVVSDLSLPEAFADSIVKESVRAF
ncbi:MAG: nucleotidyltransferase domain-containing protein [Alphaproteobacteria bacterium]|nr:nucleotidyltransferase domain-containing protein [Alphaproteobacteria bacterium]